MTNHAPESRPSDDRVDLSGQTSRVLDACFNRGREGLRVLEDCARFCCDRRDLVSRLRELRHELTSGERRCRRDIAKDEVPTARDVAGDVGTGLTTPAERRRTNLPDIVNANACRVQEALRSLEEFGKLLDTDLAEAMKQLRYQSYDVHRDLLAACREFDVSDCPRRRRLQASQICVLVTEHDCQLPWQQVVHEALAGGADIVQLREKQLPDGELVRRATWAADACRSANALFIVNDRTDVAVLSGSDGVHLGQDDCRPEDARRFIGEERLIGVSTHGLQQARTAVLAGADYLGVGPVFATATKPETKVAGREFVQQATCLEIPWFAIGGIGVDSLASVISAGATRIAVSSAILASANPRSVVEELRDALTVAADPEESHI